MFHSKNKAGQWIAYGADQGHPTPGLVTKLVTGKGVILGWGRPFTFAPEEIAAPLIEGEAATSRHEMPLKPEHYPPVVETVTPAVTTPVFKNIFVGSKGSNVKTVQAKVGVKADGIFGPITAKAVKVWQGKNGLTVSGIVDEATWNKIVGK
jgi:hypothetical protein